MHARLFSVRFDRDRRVCQRIAARVIEFARSLGMDREQRLSGADFVVDPYPHLDASYLPHRSACQLCGAGDVAVVDVDHPAAVGSDDVAAKDGFARDAQAALRFADCLELAPGRAAVE